MFFGNKETFGIEIQLDEKSNSFAHILIYVSNIYIGTVDDTTYIKSFLSSLESNFCTIQKLPLRLRNTSPKDVFLQRFYVDECNDDIDSLNVILEDTFDPFFMMVYKLSSGEIIFSWSLWDKNFRDKSYPIGVQVSKINYLFLKQTISECINYFSDL